MLMLPSTLVKLLTAYCAGLLFQFALTGHAYSAEYYRWVDENGVLHITDNLHDVPPNQRPRAGRVVAPDSPRPAEPERKAAPT